MNPQDAAAATAVKQAQGYLATLGHSFTIEVIIPLAMFVAMFLVLWYLLGMAQRKPDFNIEKIFMDDNGKPSIMPMISLLAFAVSTWYLAAKTLAGKTDSQEYFYFLLFWSGAAVAIEFAKKWDGRLPGARGSDGVVVQQTNVAP